MHKLEDLFKGFCVYYTEPYSPEQIGSDEHSNGRFRKYFPKKTDFSFVSNTMIQHVENTLNVRPMKLLKYKTPKEVFDSKLVELVTMMKIAT